MNPVIETTADTMQMSDSPGLIKRLGVFTYGILSYNIGVVGLVWLLLAVGGLAPAGFSPLQTGSATTAILLNMFLITLFGLQHSIMARAGFKERLKKLLPEATERATYVMMSGIVTIMAIYFWQPLPGTVWSVENTFGQVALWVAFAAGWSYLFIATFVTNHFELMGLRQVYLYLVNKPYTTLPFTRKYMYSYSRHPMMLGLLIGLWAIPVMSVAQFVMSLCLTLYIVVGVALEERDLVNRFGETYREYRKQIATLLPKVF